MDRGAWQATVHGVTESDMPEGLMHTHRNHRRLTTALQLVRKQEWYPQLSPSSLNAFLTDLGI